MTAEPHSPPKDRDGTTTGWIVGAYAAAPSRAGWNPADEASFYNALADLPGVVGFEVPFADTLHKVDEDWLLAQLSSDVDIVVTTAPGTSARVRASARYGLASTDADGLEAALLHTEATRAAVHRLNDASAGKPCSLLNCTRPLPTSMEYRAATNCTIPLSRSRLGTGVARVWSSSTAIPRSPGRSPLKAIFRWKTRSELSAKRTTAPGPRSVSASTGVGRSSKCVMQMPAEFTRNGCTTPGFSQA